MTQEFLPKAPEEALVVVKGKLYSRLTHLREWLDSAESDDYGYLDPTDQHIAGEVVFLQNLLDLIERS